MNYKEKYIEYKTKYLHLKKQYSQYNQQFGGDYHRYALHDYFGCSSHNTYLENGQLFGSSSSDQYVNILNEGCRHVELDVYDGSKPVVKHSLAPTGHVELEEILKKIMDYHHQNKDHSPIILNIENNCKKDCNRIRDICKTILHSSISDKCHCHISANSKYIMRNYFDKIVIRDKPQNMEGIVGISKLDTKDKKEIGIFDHHNQTTNVNCCPCSTLSINYSDLANELMFQSLFNYKANPNDRLMGFKRCMTFINKAKNLTTRVYPPGKNINSSNYDTIICTSLGINYTAINFQVNDKYKQIYMSLFANSNGYMLKPEYLRTSTFNLIKKKYNIAFISDTTNNVLNSTVNVQLYTGFYTYYMIDRESLHVKNFRLNHFNFACYENDISVLYFYTDKLFTCIPLAAIKESGVYRLQWYKQNSTTDLPINITKATTYEGLKQLPIAKDFNNYFGNLQAKNYTMIISINIDH